MTGWQKCRMALSFETKKSAKQKRQLTLNDNNEPAAKRKKDHIGTNETWDKEALKAEVEGNSKGSNEFIHSKHN